MQYEGENERLKDTTRCAGVRADLKMCLLKSDCCVVYNRSPKECLRTYDASVPEECQTLRTLLYECKRSIIDGRRRFRGPKGY